MEIRFGPGFSPEFRREMESLFYKELAEALVSRLKGVAEVFEKFGYFDGRQMHFKVNDHVIVMGRTASGTIYAYCDKCQRNCKVAYALSLLGFP